MSRAFQRFKGLPAAGPRLIGFLGLALLIAILLAPSIWMLSVIPPLWKDVDAYIQVTQPPGVGTVLHYGPLYCFVARIPLYLGHAIDCLRAGAPVPTAGFFFQPVLSDSGVFLLLCLQHLGLCAAAIDLITLASRLFLVRLVLAVAWAINPLFYAFAQCVGSETLSMILVLLIAAAGLRIIRHPRGVPWKDWCLFGILLWLCVLTRHINLMLAALMPLAFFLLSLQRLTMIPFARSQSLRRWRRLRMRQDLQKAVMAFAVGISCIVFANVSLRVFSRAAHIHYHSRLGFTFMWRLKFLSELPPETRNDLLDRVASRTSSPDARKVILSLSEAFPEGPNSDVIAFLRQAELSLAPETKSQDERFAIALNAVAQAFLWPPQRILLGTVATDFARSREATIRSVVNHLFAGTTFFFSNPESMPGCASLVTFRDKTAPQIVAVFKKHSYFHRRKNFSYNAFLLFWLTNLVVLTILAMVRNEKIAALASYAAALTLLGLAMMLANCFLAEFLPRYTLPMWELTILSVSLLFGRAMDCLVPVYLRR